MKKLLIVLNIVFVGVIIYLVVTRDKKEAPIEAPATETPVNTESGEVTSQNQILGGEEEESLSGGSSEYLKIDAKYPSFDNKATSKLVKEFIDDQFKTFKQESSFESLPQEEKDRMKENGSQYEFITTYKIYRTENTASIVFSIYTYMGGAHGGHILRSLNFREGDEQFTIGDVFKPGSGYLATLSKLSRTKLKAALGNELGNWSDDGTTPVTSNFEAFYLTEGKLHIIFQPYQVAPWASGAPEITIDLASELKDVISSTFLNE